MDPRPPSPRLDPLVAEANVYPSVSAAMDAAGYNAACKGLALRHLRAELARLVAAEVPLADVVFVILRFGPTVWASDRESVARRARAFGERALAFAVRKALAPSGHVLVIVRGGPMPLFAAFAVPKASPDATYRGAA